jgi:Zn-dependent M28 family amino/carboxypeptidase
MKHFLLISFFVILSGEFHAQSSAVKDSLVARVKYLSSENLQGRGNYSRGLLDAAFYLSDRFQKAGLKVFPGFKSYFQSFAIRDYQKKISDSNNIDYRNELVNVIGVLEGKTKPSQAIIISAHYDHLGRDGSIFNGANDNASGVAIMLGLMDHYIALGNNERTIIFCAFAGEELGLFGSDSFSNFIEPDSIMAMINFDMVGLPSFGRNVFLFTGEEHSDLFKILNEALEKEKMKAKRDSDPAKHYFFRSDNYPFAKLGIPAHTVMATSDTDACYHSACDDFSRINFEYMLLLLKSMQVALQPVIDGTKTPRRIKTKFSY